jgi:hypothetical protein
MNKWCIWIQFVHFSVTVRTSSWGALKYRVIGKSRNAQIKLLVVAIKYSFIGLINTQYRCDYRLQEPSQVTSCCNLLAPVRQLFFNSWSAMMSFSQVQRMFIVEHHLASRSYLTSQNEFRDTFPSSPVPNKFTVSRLVNRFRETENVIRHEERVNACITKRDGHFQHLIFIDFCFLISLWFIFWQIQHVSGIGCVTFRSPCIMIFLSWSGLL